MATGKEENTQQFQAANVAEMSVASIIAALHQHAIEKSDAKSKNARIINGAIDETGDKPTIKSAGENIVSVIPIDGKQKLKKKVAVQILKTYIQWFVGPDFASKVNSSTVKSLVESPDNPKEKEVKESYSFMSFKKFLQEAEDDSPNFDTRLSDGDEVENDEEDDGSPKFDERLVDDEPEEKKPEEEKDQPEDDESEESKVGYYIPYKLEIEGMKQTALKDALKKYAKTFFDDITISGSGLFGGNYSFTVKDVKDKFKEAFGAINPEDLVQNVTKEIDNIRNPNTNPPEVRIRDKNTLISDLGDSIDAAQKKLISSANYSLWIKLEEDDPKKPIFDRRVVADIVTGSIKGLFKKFKNKVTKNDVVYVPNYKDIHGNAKKLQAFNRIVPKPENVKAVLAKAKSFVDAMDKLERLFDKISAKTDLISKSNFAKGCLEVWNRYYKELRKDSRSQDSSDLGDDRQDKLDAFFKSFKDEYDKTYAKLSKEETIYESAKKIVALAKIFNSRSSMKKFLLESLLEADGNPDDAKDGKKDFQEIIKKHASQIFQSIDGIEAKTIETASRNKCISLLDMFEKASDIEKYFGDFQNGLIVDFSNIISKQKQDEKSLDEASSIKNEIMSILFEKDKPANKSKKPKYPSETVVMNAFDLLIDKAELSDDDYKMPYPLSYDKSDTHSKSNPEAYLMPFGGKKIEDSSEMNADDASSKDDAGKGEDLYIIPMPGLRMNDKEYDTYAD